MRGLKIILTAACMIALSSCRDEAAEKEAARKAAWEAEKARGNNTVQETPGESYAN